MKKTLEKEKKNFFVFSTAAEQNTDPLPPTNLGSKTADISGFSRWKKILQADLSMAAKITLTIREEKKKNKF